jgi:hypothetical protein
MASSPGDDAGNPPETTTAPAAPAFDAGATGLRKRGDTSGGASLTAAASDVIEVYWSVENADVVRILRDGGPVGDPDRVTDGFCPLWISGLTPGDYALKLQAGTVAGDDIAWADDGAIDLTLTLTPYLAITDFSGAPEPDDGKEHLDHDLQLDDGAKVRLSFTALNAKQVRITATAESPSDYSPVDVDGEGKGQLLVDPAGVQTKYTAVAIDGDAASQPSWPVTAHFHDADDVVSPVVAHEGGGAAKLALLDANGAAPSEGQLKLGVGGGLQLQWSVEGASKATLTATSLLKKPAAQVDPPQSIGHVSNDQLMAGFELPLSASGAGEGIIVVDPGPDTTTEYALSVTARDAEPVTGATVTAYVANFNVQLRLPDGTLAKNLPCVLQPDGGDPIGGMTNALGELWLWLPNTAVTGTLSAIDGADVVATWPVSLTSEEGIGDGVLAMNVTATSAEPA